MSDEYSAVFFGDIVPADCIVTNSKINMNE